MHLMLRNSGTVSIQQWGLRGCSYVLATTSTGPGCVAADVAVLLLLLLIMCSSGAGVAGFLQQFCWSYTSVRQTNRLRRRYLTAVLRQDVAFFDTQVCTSLGGGAFVLWLCG